MKVTCQQCNIKFDISIGKFNFNKRNGYKIYCSNKCRHIGKQNRITKKCVVCKKEMIVHACASNRYSTCSLKCRRNNRSGNKNSNYVDGSRNHRQRERKLAFSRLEYKTWRNLILTRDDYTCQFCGTRKLKNMHVDHIKPWAYFPKLRYKISNGRTLCQKCHRTTFKNLAQYKNRVS